MQTISFLPEFLDPLLRGDKQQTTRPQTDRIKVGDVCNIYIEQRAPLTSKPIRVMTWAGQLAIADRVNDVQYNYPAECPPSPFRDKFEPVYYAHFLGKVEITEVYDMRHPIGIFPIGLEEWALKDGFDTYLQADDWFTKRYGNLWLYQNWTVIRWDGWTERYFEPEL